MLEKYEAKELWDLYQNLPKKIQNIFWDKDISSRIEKTSARFELSEEKTDTLVRIVAFIYLGILPPSRIKQVLEEEMALREEKSKVLADEIIRFLIAPLGPLLRELYSKEEIEGVGIKSFKEEKKEKNSSEFGDVYREPLDE